MREKIAAACGRIKSSKWLQRAEGSRAVGYIRQGSALCRENPFPAQVLLTVGYRLALDAMYIVLLSPVFGYSGFTTDLSPLWYVFSLLVTVVFAPFVVQLLNDDTPSSSLLTFVNYLYFIPLTSYCGCSHKNERFFLLAILYWAVLVTLQWVIPRLYLAPMPLKHLNTGWTLFTVCCILFVLLISGRYTGFRLTLNFMDVYGIRAESAAYSIPGIFGYALSMMKTFLAALILYWLRKKKYAVVAVLGVTYLFYFSVQGLKSVFFFLFLALASYFFYRKWMLRWMPGLLIGVTVASVLEEKILGCYYIMNLFLRRMMYVPAALGEQYLEFFSENPLNLFQNGIMSKFSFENIYSAGIPSLIGEYRGNPGEIANNGLLGDLAANLPALVGLLLLPLVLILCLRLLDLCAKGLEGKYLMPFSVFFANTFMNASWSTVLLSHGFLFTCLILYVFPKEEVRLK